MQYIQLQGQVAADLDTPLEGGFNLFIDTNDGSIKSKDSEGNISSTGGGGLVETTYNQLTASLDSGSLTPGTYYKITDFKTCYDQPNYNFNGNEITTGNYKTGSLSPIIVFALDSGALASDAFQPQHPNDNIKYDISFNQTEIEYSPNKYFYKVGSIFIGGNLLVKDSYIENDGLISVGGEAVSYTHLTLPTKRIV